MTIFTDAANPDVLRYAAFTTDPAGGNPAGGVLDASGLGEAAMLAVAAEGGGGGRGGAHPASGGRHGTARSAECTTAEGRLEGTGVRRGGPHPGRELSP